MGQIGILGGLSVDHIVRAYGEARFDCLGGPGLYASLGASLVDGASVRLAGRLPEDPAGLRQALEHANVNLDHCAAGGTAQRLWILYSPEGRRIVPTTALSPIEIAGDYAGETDGFAPDTRFFDQLDALLDCAPRQPVTNVARHTAYGVDPDQRDVHQRGWSYWEAIAARTDILLPSRMQLLLVDDDPILAAERLHNRLQVSVVARLDKDGVFVIEVDGGRWTIRDTRVRVIDPTGAGDVMAGATLAARGAGHDVVTAAAAGVSAARLVLADWGPAGLLNHAEPITGPYPGVEITKD